MTHYNETIVAQFLLTAGLTRRGNAYTQKLCDECLVNTLVTPTSHTPAGDIETHTADDPDVNGSVAVFDRRDRITFTQAKKASLYSAQHFPQLHLLSRAEPSTAMGLTRKEALEKIDRTAAMSDGWDGYDTYPVLRRVANRAKAILMRLAAIPFVSATPDRTIQFEFEDNHGYLEFEIDGSEPIRVAQALRRDADDWQEKSVEGADVPGIVQDFCAENR